MKYYSDFIFGQKSLSSFGGIIYNDSDTFKKTIGRNPKHITLTIPNKGQIYYGTEYEPYQFDVPCYFERTLSEAEITEWIINSGEQPFQYVGDDKAINAVYNGMLDFSIYGNDIIQQSIVTIPFIAYGDSLWYSTKNETYIISDSYTANEVNFETVANRKSFPLISFTADSSVVGFEWNNKLNFSMKNLTKGRTYYIDTSNDDVYYMLAGSKIFVVDSYESDMYYTMPTIEPKMTNTLRVVRGHATNIKVVANSKIIE